MTKQTIFSITIIIIVAVALFFGIRALNNASQAEPTPPIDSGRMMGKLPAGSTPPPQTSDIVGQTWVWERNIIGGDGVAPVAKPGEFTITFGTDGKVSGTTDCNGFGGDYAIGSEGVISFGPFMSTLMYCEGSQEQDFTSSLAQATRMTMDADGNLVLILGETSNVMVFSKK